MTVLDGQEPTVDTDAMDYEEFRAAFLDALRASGLPVGGATHGDDVLDLRSSERTFTVHVAAIGDELSAPFHVSGAISWRWDALQAARTATTEEDLLVELLGRQVACRVETERPWLRVDIRLLAGVEFGKSIPMPGPAAWARWSREAGERLERVEPLIPGDAARETPEGHLAVLAWQGAPEITLTCAPPGELRLESVSVQAFQIIDLPRRWDDPDRRPDDHPREQLAAMFRRARAALHAWGEVMDHLARP